MKTKLRHIGSQLTVIIALLSTAVYADKYSGGSGIKTSPYILKSLSDLKKLSETSSDWSKHFILHADIDAEETKTWNVGDHDNDSSTAETAMGFSPIGTNQSRCFTGTFNGNRHKISNLYINRPRTTYTGLFGVIGSRKSFKATIENLSLENCSISGVISGSIAAFTTRVYIKNCQVSGRITGIVETGGLMGICEASKVEYSTADVYVKCVEGDAGGYAGLADKSEFYNCRATGVVESLNVKSSMNYNADKSTACIIDSTKLKTLHNCRSTAQVVTDEFLESELKQVTVHRH